MQGRWLVSVLPSYQITAQIKGGHKSMPEVQELHFILSFCRKNMMTYGKLSFFLSFFLLE
jgi:hypothetical protein